MIYECPSQDRSWKYLDSALKLLGLKGIKISNGKIGGRGALLNSRGFPVWAVRRVATDCDEVIDALRSFEYFDSGKHKERRHLKVPTYSPEMIFHMHQAFRLRWEGDAQDGFVGHEVKKEDPKKKQRRSEKKKDCE